MGNQIDRRRILARGLGNLSILELSPTPGTDFILLGYLNGTTVFDVRNTEVIQDESGSVVQVGEQDQAVRLESGLKQSGEDEILLLKNASSKYYAVRYYGPAKQNDRWQYYCIERGNLKPGVSIEYKPGQRILPITAFAFDKSDEAGYSIPPYYFSEARKDLNIDYCHLWIDSRKELNLATTRILDISGFSNHGLLTATGLWTSGTTPARFIRLDGTDDSVSFGDLFDDDASADFWIEGWFRIQANDDVALPLLTKIQAFDGTGSYAGFSLFRKTDNKIYFHIDDSSASAQVASAGTVTQNVWTHIAVSIDRNGNGQIYLNGAASGAPVSVAGVGSAANAIALYLGRDNAGSFGKFDFSIVRYHKVSIPSDIATIIGNHYDGEKGYHGL